MVWKSLTQTNNQFLKMEKVHSAKGNEKALT